METTTEIEGSSRPVTLSGVLRTHRYAFAGVALLVVVMVGIIGELARPDRPQYHAEALVVANELEVRVESLPKTAVAVFETSATADQIAELAGTGVDSTTLIPEIVRAEPVETTPVIEIEATHHDPELAAVYANTGALALTRELNRIGPGLGSFSVQQWALVPKSPIPVSRRQLAIAAVVAGIAITLGGAALTAAANHRRNQTPS